MNVTCNSIYIASSSEVICQSAVNFPFSYTTAKERLDAVETEIANRTSRSTMIAAFLDNLEKQDNLITDFDTGLWNTVIETMTIYSRERVVFKFKGGTEVEWAIS